MISRPSAMAFSPRAGSFNSLAPGWSKGGATSRRPLIAQAASQRAIVGAYSVAHFGESLLGSASKLLFALFLTETYGLGRQR